MTLRRLPILLALICSPLPGQAARPNNCAEDAVRYWETFRLAALGTKVAAVVDLAAFPFLIRSIPDDGPGKKLDRAGFIRRWPALLAADPGSSARPTTMKAFTQATPSLTSRSCNPDGQSFRVGNWVFRLGGQGWRFSEALGDE